jgi:hypothetical protein
LKRSRNGMKKSWDSTDMEARPISWRVMSCGSISPTRCGYLEELWRRLDHFPVIAQIFTWCNSPEMRSFRCAVLLPEDSPSERPESVSGHCWTSEMKQGAAFRQCHFMDSSEWGLICVFLRDLTSWHYYLFVKVKTAFMRKRELCQDVRSSCDWIQESANYLLKRLFMLWSLFHAKIPHHNPILILDLSF